MARPPQYQYPENDSFAVAKVKDAIKDAIKELSPEARAYVMAWLVKFYNDTGGMFSPQVSQERRKISLDSETFWLVKIRTK